MLIRQDHFFQNVRENRSGRVAKKKPKGDDAPESPAAVTHPRERTSPTFLPVRSATAPYQRAPMFPNHQTVPCATAAAIVLAQMEKTSDSYAPTENELEFITGTQCMKVQSVRCFWCFCVIQCFLHPSHNQLVMFRLSQPCKDEDPGSYGNQEHSDKLEQRGVSLWYLLRGAREGQENNHHRI